MGGGPPRFPPNPTWWAVLTRPGHPASPIVAYGTLTPSGDPFQRSSADGRTPRGFSGRSPCRRSHRARPTPGRHRRQPVPPPGFGLFPSRSPLRGDSSRFLGVLRCFSSPGSPRRGHPRRRPGLPPGRLPHSGIPGSPAASASPGRFAAWPRPSSARDAIGIHRAPSSVVLPSSPCSPCSPVSVLLCTARAARHRLTSLRPTAPAPRPGRHPHHTPHHRVPGLRRGSAARPLRVR